MIPAPRLLDVEVAAAAARPRTETPSDRLAWQREMERAQSDAWFKPRSDAELSGGGLAQQQAGRAMAPGRAEQDAAMAARTSEWRSPAAGLDEPPASAAPTITGHGSHGGDAGSVEASPASQAHVTEPARAGVLTGSLRVGAASIEQPVATTAAAWSMRFAPLTALPPWTSSPPNVLPSPDSLEAPVTSRQSQAARSERLEVALLQALSPRQPVRLHVQWEGDAARVWVGVDAPSVDTPRELAQALTRWLSGMGMRLRGLVCNGQSWVEQAETPQAARLAQRPVSPGGSQAESIIFIDIIAKGEF